jgi:serine phosphatase RsbU (regulator of sigma subunit)
LPPDDTALLREASRRAGLSLENALLYAREHALSEALQRAMLPEAAEIPGLDVWASYTPNLEHAQVGGDWFDVLPTTDEVAVVVVGDVVGHDIEAAATMGQMRSVIRAYAYEIDDPAGVLMRADQLVRGMKVSRLASVVLVALRPEDGGWRATWSSAGHLPPLLRRAARSGRPAVVEPLDGGRGPLLGLGDGPRRTASAHLETGDVLVLYTDGLVERRARPMPDGIALLADALREARASGAASMGERLLDSVGGSPEDDAAVVSELVTNALLHGDGEIALRLHADGGGLRLEVEDGSPVAPQVAEGRAAGYGGYGLRIVQRLSSWGWYPTRFGKVVWAYIPKDAPAVLTPR